MFALSIIKRPNSFLLWPSLSRIDLSIFSYYLSICMQVITYWQGAFIACSETSDLQEQGLPIQSYHGKSGTLIYYNETNKSFAPLCYCFKDMYVESGIKIEKKERFYLAQM